METERKAADGDRDRADRYRAKTATHLRRYLQILDHQHDAIVNDDADSIEFYLRAGSETLTQLQAVRTAAFAWNRGEESDPAILDLMEAVRTAHTRNHEMLTRRREEIRDRLDGTRVPRRARSVFRPADGGGAAVDISL